MENPILSIEHISKKIGNDVILRDASLQLYEGQVIGLIGTNGSGKSTLIRHIGGLLQPDSGEIRMHGKPTDISSPAAAMSAGIAVLYQDINLIPELSVAENIYLQKMPQRRTRIEWKKLYASAADILRAMDVRIDPQQRVSELCYAQKRTIELAKVLVQQAQVIVLDEPCLNFTGIEFDKFMQIVMEFKQIGVCFLIVSHELQKLAKICDAFVYMNAGKTTNAIPAKSIDMDHLYQLFCVSESDFQYPKISYKLGAPVFTFDHVFSESGLSNATFCVHKHEIFGIWGTSLPDYRVIGRTLFGKLRMTGGSICVDGQRINPASTYSVIRAGVSYLSEDISNSAFQNFTVPANITVGKIEDIGFREKRSADLEYRYVEDLLNALNIRISSSDMKMQELSGGNQQKARIARALFASSKIYILEDPTSGIDICSICDVYNALSNLAGCGAAVVLISTDLGELKGMCDRIAVITDGRIKRVVSKADYYTDAFTLG
jgi:ABC-type sugar transport system ATPase subunit